MIPNAWIVAAVTAPSSHLVTIDRGFLKPLKRSQMTVLQPYYYLRASVSLEHDIRVMVSGVFCVPVANKSELEFIFVRQRGELRRTVYSQQYPPLDA